MLIDGGAAFSSGFDMGEMVISPFLRKKRIRKIDYLVMSHAQRDHKGGLPYIARSFDIGEFWWNGKGNISAITNALETKRSTTIIMDSSTRTLNIEGVQISILNPGAEEKAGLNLNEASLVMKLTYKEKSILFTGDIGIETETALTKKHKLHAHILKAPHHGSKYSSSIAFLDKVSPGFVIISVGRNNRYGFPHKEALKRFQKKKARVFRTDLRGAVEVITDGKTIVIKGHKKGS